MFKVMNIHLKELFQREATFPGVYHGLKNKNKNNVGEYLRAGRKTFAFKIRGRYSFRK
jgi:hypothetical protein